MLKDQKIFLATKRKLKVEDPKEEDIFTIGTVCSIKQILKLPGNTVRVLVEGECRGKIIEFIEEEDLLRVEIEEIRDKECTEDNKCEALFRLVKILLKSIQSL